MVSLGLHHALLSSPQTPRTIAKRLEESPVHYIGNLLHKKFPLLFVVEFADFIKPVLAPFFVVSWHRVR